MWNSLRTVSGNLLRCFEQFTQPKRTTFILKRTHPARLNKLGANFPKKLKRKHFYYELVADTFYKQEPPIELVLTSDVPGVGMKGEKIVMNPFMAYRDLLLPKLALYADLPEAQTIMRTQKEKQYSSIYSKIVENYLVSQPVKVFLSRDVNWTLKPWHVKVALRKCGILANDDCISIPKEISGPKDEIENKDFIVYLTMNKMEVYPLRCRIYHWSALDASLNQKSFDIDSPSEALFPEEKEKIDAMIKNENDIKKSKMIRGEGNEEQKKKKKKHWK